MSVVPATMIDTQVVELLHDLVVEVRGLRGDLRAIVGAGERAASTDDHHRDRLLRARDVAELLGVDVRTLRQLRHERAVPEPIMVGRSPRWRRSTIERWLEEQAK